MAAPTISIVTPSLNHASFLEDAIASVLRQNYDNLEYILIDGGSSDGSLAILEKYRSRLHYCVSEPDSGHGHALNKGFRQSSGEIMAWLNSDDQYMPWAFKTVAEIFEAHPDVNWIVGTNSWFNDKGAMYLVNNVYKNVLDLVSGNFEWIQQESVFWRRSLWERAGGQINQNYKFMVDGELWTRFFRIEPLWHVHAVLSGYRMHPGNRAKLHIEECRTEMLRAIDDMRPHVDPSRLGPLQRNYPVLVYDLENLRWVKRLLRRAAQTEPPGVSG